jgi:hypothetical protein
MKNAFSKVPRIGRAGLFGRGWHRGGRSLQPRSDQHRQRSQRAHRQRKPRDAGATERQRGHQRHGSGPEGASGKPPMRVNSQTKVANLNSDLLDSKDSTGFVSSSIYTKVGPVVQGVANIINNTFLTCDDRDKMLSGGYTMIHLNGAIASGFDVAKDQVAVSVSFELRIFPAVAQRRHA